MTRYFFDIHNGFSSIDDTGLELKGLEDAKVEALRFFGSFINENADNIAHSGDDWSVTIEDESKTTVCRVLLLSRDVAALPGGNLS